MCVCGFALMQAVSYWGHVLLANASGAAIRLDYEQIKSEMRASYDGFVADCQWLLVNAPPDTEELVRCLLQSQGLVLLSGFCAGHLVVLHPNAVNAARRGRCTLTRSTPWSASTATPLPA